MATVQMYNMCMSKSTMQTCCWRAWPTALPMMTYVCLCPLLLCSLTPYLTSLSTSQLKLLTIYVERAQQKQQQQHNGTVGSISYHGMAMQSGSPYARH